MNRSARAIIRWLPRERGGRNHPLDNAEGYAVPARFESDVQQQQGIWTVRLTDVANLRDHQCIRATVQFISPEAPQDLLEDGERFELLEGPRVVAKGVLIPRAIPIPNEVSEFDLALLG